nr:uncharacterized protein LOC111513351 [Leptinotarsa decemlineata]
MPNSSPESASVASARLRLPAFTVNDPELWFQRVEWILEDTGVKTSSEKFRELAKSFDDREAGEVRDLILNPPADRPYEQLKDTLLRRLVKSQAQKTRQQLEREDIGDRTPSQFLRHLQALAGPSAADDIIRTMWMDRIIPLVRASLAVQVAQPGVSLDDLARTADSVTDAMGAIAPQQRVSAVSSTTESWLREEFSRLSAQLAEQHREINALRAERRQRRGQQQSRDRSCSRNRMRSQSVSRVDGLCWYHHRFGRDAYKCRQPCAFSASAMDTGNAPGSR